MLVIGLTGGIGSGKSTVADLFAELGVPVIDADVIARELVEPGQATLQRIVHAFGQEVLQPDGKLDRARLRTLVFSDPQQRQRLESIMHPSIRAALQKRAAAVTAPYCVVVIPLLFETGQADLVNRALVVDTRTETQIARTVKRSGLDRATVERIMAAQWQRARRLASADDVIANNSTLDELRAQVLPLHRRYLALAAQT